MALDFSNLRYHLPPKIPKSGHVTISRFGPVEIYHDVPTSRLKMRYIIDRLQTFPVALSLVRCFGKSSLRMHKQTSAGRVKGPFPDQFYSPISAVVRTTILYYICEQYLLSEHGQLAIPGSE